MTHATEKWKNCVVTLQALVLHGHKVPDMKLNRGPEIKFMGISFTREQEETFLLDGLFFKAVVAQGTSGGTQCLMFCEIEENNIKIHIASHGHYQSLCSV